MLNGKATIVLLMAGLTKKDIIYMSEYFSEPKSSGGKVKVELDLSSYTTKADLKNETGADTSKLAKRVGLANLKSNVDKFDFDELKMYQVV